MTSFTHGLRALASAAALAAGIADVCQSNGAAHVIDTVLMPK